MAFVCGRCHAAFVRLDKFVTHLQHAHGLRLRGGRRGRA